MSPEHGLMGLHGRARAPPGAAAGLHSITAAGTRT